MQYLSGGWKGIKYGTLSAGIGAIIYTKYVDSGPYTTLYKLCLKTFNPDTVHKLNKVFISMGLIHKVDQSIYKGVLDQNLGQLYLPNILGLAAGYEADGNITKDLVDMGFGYVEIGSLNPQLDVESKAQLENNKILPHQQRVEYNRDIDNLTILKPQAYVGSLKRSNDQSKQKYVIGANISPNAEAKLYTPYLCEQDFITGGQEALQFSDYVVLNLQGPQSKGIEHLLNIEKMKEIIDEIKKERTLLYAKQAVFEYFRRLWYSLINT
ncbi:hypothetical protein PPERSA_03452 [Pseudocohnilembus persalinus]|uniref:Dihydroorotate dehydrogenase catalytic domain-containing protein n=1 Tax=Pseudocohnilembus persalinus TaxID=266149 RepID=A0A0V0QBP3_PSEPJ|nr:hypothetical protein PPERSA_03452 [Pseudocohnilembus persalinus]|eukprot:KRW99651.1 hypothetical protein PPERSA_03452 [Pseudocohnilembus persalinus]